MGPVGWLSSRPTPPWSRTWCFWGSPPHRSIWACINKKGTLDCRFSWGDSGEHPSQRKNVYCLHSRNAIRFPLDTVIPVHVLLCKLLPTCPRKFPSIFWIHLVLASSLQARPLSKATAGSWAAAICSWLLPAAPLGYRLVHLIWLSLWHTELHSSCRPAGWVSHSNCILPFW